MACDMINESDKSSPEPEGELVDNSSQRTARLAQLYNNPKFSDVILCVDHRQYYAHKLLLASASDVFE